MSWVIGCYGWGIPEDEEFDEDRHQKKMRCWVTDGDGCSQRFSQALKFALEHEAQEYLWNLDEWWEKDDDGAPMYWVEEVKPIPEHDRVELIVKGKQAPKGSVGTVVHVYAGPAQAMEVEFSRPQCVLTLRREEVNHVDARPAATGDPGRLPG